MRQEAPVRVRRGYLDVDGRQLHYRDARPAPAAPLSMPIVCLHQTPTSSLEFEPLMRELATDRVVFAPDTPGYGGSDGPDEPQSIEFYAAALAQAMDQAGFGAGPLGRAVLFGYHTGAVLAAQIAFARPDLVVGIVLHGFPLRTPDERRQRLEALPRDLDLDGYFRKVEGYYDMHVRRAPDSLSLFERTRVFSQDMVAGPNFWFSYHGVWTWSYEERLPRIAVPALALAANEALREATIEASRIVPDCELREMPHWGGSASLRIHAGEVAAAVREFAARLAPRAER
jgi:pimeloyl-ACP methyl ester carboxylesterase